MYTGCPGPAGEEQCGAVLFEMHSVHHQGMFIDIACIDTIPTRTTPYLDCMFDIYPCHHIHIIHYLTLITPPSHH